MDIYGEQICLLTDGLLHVTLHKQVFILAHLNILLGEWVLITNKLFDCGQVLVLSPFRVAGIGKHIHMAVLTFSQTYIELTDFG